MSIDPSVYSMMTKVSLTYTYFGDVGFAVIAGISITGVLVIDAISRALALVANRNVVKTTTSENKNFLIIIIRFKFVNNTNFLYFTFSAAKIIF